MASDIEPDAPRRYRARSEKWVRSAWIWLWRALGALAVVGLIAGGVLLVLPFFVEDKSFDALVQKELSTWTRREAILSRVRLRTLGGFGVVVDNLQLLGSDGNVDLKARQAFIELDFFALILQDLKVRLVELDEARIDLKRNRDGRWNWADLQPPDRPSGTLKADLTRTGLRLIGASVAITDAQPRPAQQFLIAPLSLKLDDLDERTLLVSVQGAAADYRSKRIADLSADGRLLRPVDGDWFSSQGELKILCRKFRPRLLRDYTRQIAGLSGLAGVYDFDGDWRRDSDNRVSLKGKLFSRLLHWRWPEVLGKKIWQVRNLGFEGAVSLTGSTVAVERLRVSTEGIDVQLAGKVVTPGNPKGKAAVDLKLNSAYFDPFSMRDKLPVTLLPYEVRDWLPGSRGSGKLRAEIQLNGPFDRYLTTGTIEAANFAVSHPKLRSAVERLDGKLLLAKTAISMGGLRVGAPGLEATLSGTVSRRAGGPVRLKIVSGRTELAPFSALLSERLGLVRGRAGLDLEIAGTLKAPELRGWAELAGVSIKQWGWPRAIEGLRGRLLFEPARLTLAGLSARVGDSTVGVDGVLNSYSFGDTFSRFTARSRDLDLRAAGPILASNLLGETFGRNFAARFGDLGGRAGIDLEVSGGTTKGRIALKGARFVLAELGAQVADMRGMLILRNGDLTTEDGIAALVNGSPVGFFGESSMPLSRVGGPNCTERTVELERAQNRERRQCRAFAEQKTETSGEEALTPRRSDCPCSRGGGLSSRCRTRAENNLRDSLQLVFTGRLPDNICSRRVPLRERRPVPTRRPPRPEVLLPAEAPVVPEPIDNPAPESPASVPP
ncbi:hypothetical protein [Gloeobacter violaceus]|uniref:Gll0583 protein n=1 Tax=Gloeobacter violaceus (strain ATCC 29082 / PCC 7421) TaxID=251221 RepID=Q7NN31_GLOVI|nr:hypothetical protein [Gloeobacter violaceus]BAC88524.1 gll0583 [Gloeobacter violaceus PCC 7421]